jgi:hypothetical protein
VKGGNHFSLGKGGKVAEYPGSLIDSIQVFHGASEYLLSFPVYYVMERRTQKGSKWTNKFFI